MSGTHVDATFYAQVEPEWSRFARETVDGERVPMLDGAKVVRITRQRPESPKPGTVLVKLTIRVPANAFRPLRPAAVVVIPENLTETTPIEVEAADPTGEQR